MPALKMVSTALQLTKSNDVKVIQLNKNTFS